MAIRSARLAKRCLGRAPTRGDRRPPAATNGMRSARRFDAFAAEMEGNLDDPVRMYLREIGRVPLLSARTRRSRWPSAWSAASWSGSKPVTEQNQRIMLRRRGGPAQVDRGQPAAGGQRRQEVHRPRHEPAGPDPGRQHRPDPRRREVRLHQGLQVLHLRDLVDSPGDHPRHRRPGAHHPHPGPHGGDDQPPDPHQPASAAGAGPRADRRGDRRGDGDHAGEGARDHQGQPGAGQPGDADRRGGRQPPGRLHRGSAPRWRPPTPPATNCSRSR